MKQFNLQEAKRGADVCTVKGNKVRILCYDSRISEGYPILALVDRGETEEQVTYTLDGRFNAGFTHDNDLRMVDGEDIIKTWDDIPAGMCPNTNKLIDQIYRIMGFDVARKMVATAKIDLLIDLGYGGKVRDEDWENPNKTVWVITALDDEYCVTDISGSDNYRVFLAFHSEDCANNFLEFNQDLVKDYYQR